MYLYTTKGYYSVVIRENKYCIRCRRLIDFDYLVDFVKSLKTYYIVQHSNNWDYEYRVYVNKGTFKKFVNHLIDKIDYDSFKGEVKRICGEKSIYYRNLVQVNHVSLINLEERLDKNYPKI